jgi:hypothetical protein
MSADGSAARGVCNSIKVAAVTAGKGDQMERDWRCTRCGKLLGLFEGDRLHIRFARGHEYLVGLPATSVCRSCRTLNEVSVARQDEEARSIVTEAQG